MVVEGISLLHSLMGVVLRLHLGCLVGFNSRPEYKQSDWCFAGRALHHEMHRPSDGSQAGCPVHEHWTVNVKDLAVYFDE